MTKFFILGHIIDSNVKAGLRPLSCKDTLHAGTADHTVLYKICYIVVVTIDHFAHASSARLYLYHEFL